MASQVVQLTLVIRNAGDMQEAAVQAIVDVFTQRVAPAVLSATVEGRPVVEKGWLTVDGVMVDD